MALAGVDNRPVSRPAIQADVDDTARLAPAPVVVDNSAMETEPFQAESPKRRRRWFQFSREPSCVHALLAIGSAWVAHRMQQKRIERETVGLIAKSGGRVAYDYQFDSAHRYVSSARPPGPDWFRSLFGENFLTNVSHVWLKGGDADLERIQGWTHLESLWLEGTSVTDAGLNNLDGLPYLRLLNLTGTKITDASLDKAKGLSKLELLYLGETKVTDAGLNNIRGLSQLEELMLTNVDVTNVGLVNLKELRRLKKLWLSGSGIGDEGLANISRLSQLQILQLASANVTDNGLTNLKALRKLDTLDLRDTKISDAGLLNINDLPQLRLLYLSSPNVTDAGLMTLKDLPCLQCCSWMVRGSPTLA